MIVFLVLALLLLDANSHAGLDNSHHDIRRYLPDKDACLVCHGRKDNNYYRVMEDDLGTVGGQCIFLCHSGKGILPETDTLVPKAGPSVSVTDYSTSQSPDYTVVFFTRSHGRRPENLKDSTGKPVPWPPFGVNWEAVAPSTKLECTSCHSVHDDRYAPFLVAPLAASYPAFDGICDRCHVDRATNNLARAPDGMHPVDFPVDNSAAAERSDSWRGPRRINIQKYGKNDGTGAVGVFDVENPAARELKELDRSWNMGGHLTSGSEAAMTGWKGTGGAQQMGCYTCHSAHRAAVNGESNLTVIRTADPANGWNPLCTGCHGSATSLSGDMDEWDAGLSGYGHPAGAGTFKDQSGLYTATLGGFKFRIADVSWVNPQSGNRLGDRGQIMCTSCHKVHFGVTGTMAIANLGQNTRVICKTCHNGVGHQLPNDGVDPPNSHHVTAYGETVQMLGFSNPPWENSVTGLGDILHGMDCADCHAMETGHNW